MSGVKVFIEVDGEIKPAQLFVHAEVGNVFIQCMLYEDYENIDEIAGHEVCGDEIVFIDPWFASTEDLKERWDDEFD